MWDIIVCHYSENLTYYRTVYYNESKEIIEDSNWTTLKAAEDYIARVTK
jgi:hypothetical protein